MDFATKVQLSTAFREAADALLGTLWIHHGDALPAFNIDELTDVNHFRLEVKNPASAEVCDQQVMMFSFMRNGQVELSIYYDLAKAETKRAVQLVDVGVMFKHSYSEAGSLLMSYYNQALRP